MGMSWLYGPERIDASATMRLRSMVLDFEVMQEIERDLTRFVRTSLPGEVGSQAEVSSSYELGYQKLTVDEVGSLRPADKNLLKVTFTIVDPARTSTFGSWVMAVSVECSSATVSSDGPYDHVGEAGARVREKVAEILIEEGSPKINSRWLGRATPLLVPVTAVIAWIWLNILIPLPVPAQLLFLTAAVPSMIWAYRRATTNTSRARLQQGRLEFRAESKSETIRRRADRRANLKVVLITAPVTLAITVIGAFFTAYFAGWFPGGAP